MKLICKMKCQLGGKIYHTGDELIVDKATPALLANFNEVPQATEKSNAKVGKGKGKNARSLVANASSVDGDELPDDADEGNEVNAASNTVAGMNLEQYKLELDGMGQRYPKDATVEQLHDMFINVTTPEI